MKAVLLLLALAFIFACSNTVNDVAQEDDLSFIVTYYPDSTISEIAQTKGKLLNGKTIKFDEFGNKAWEFNFVNDQQEGLQYYYSQGKLNFVVPYEHGKQHGWARRYTGPCGSISEEGQYQFGKRNGLWYRYYDVEVLEIDLYNSDSLIDVVHRNAKYPDRNALLPRIEKDCSASGFKGVEE